MGISLTYQRFVVLVGRVFAGVVDDEVVILDAEHAVNILITGPLRRVYSVRTESADDIDAFVDDAVEPVDGCLRHVGATDGFLVFAFIVNIHHQEGCGEKQQYDAGYR